LPVGAAISLRQAALSEEETAKEIVGDIR